MNICYSRKTQIAKEKIINNLRDFAKNFNLDIWGEKELNGFYIVGIYHKDFFQFLEGINKDLVSILPFYLIIFDEGEFRKVLILNPEILSSLVNNPEFLKIEDFYKNLVDSITENTYRKIQKIKLYASATCPYCSSEKQYLDGKNIKYEYVLVDINEEAAREMVEKTGQFGVPVTEIVYDDNETEIVIGFDKNRLEKIFKDYLSVNVDLNV